MELEKVRYYKYLPYNIQYYVTDGFSRPIKRVSEKIGLSSLNQQVVINELTSWAYKNYLNTSKLFCTRSIIDCIIHSELLFPELDVTSLYKEYEVTERRINNIFYIPIEFEMQNDGVRYNSELQLEIDKRINSFIDNYVNLPIVTLHGSVEERVKIIEKTLGL